MATHKLLLIPGDGIGLQVMAEAKRVIGFLNEQIAVPESSSLPQTNLVAPDSLGRRVGRP